MKELDIYKPRDVDIDVSQPVRVEVSEYRERTNLQIRHWWEPDGSNDLVRTKKGVTIPLDDTLVLVNAILDLYNEATNQSFEVVEADDGQAS